MMGTVVVVGGYDLMRAVDDTGDRLSLSLRGQFN